MADRYVLVPATPPALPCYHLPQTRNERHPYCFPSETYERIAFQTAQEVGLRRCQRCAQKNGTGHDTDTETTCPFCSN